MSRGSVAWRRLSLFGWTIAVCVVPLAIAAPAATAGKEVSAVFGQAGAEAGEFDFPGGVAVNQVSGDVYLVDIDNGTGGNRVNQYSADGDFIRAWGWGVATGADSFEKCTTTCQAGIAGPGEGQFASGFNNSDTDGQLAIDQADGSVYVADTLNDRVQKFSATGDFLDVFGTTGSGDGELVRPQGVAVDPATRDVYVGDTTSADGSVVSHRVQRFDSSGAYQSQVGTTGGGSQEGEFQSPVRLTVDSSGRLYVLDRDNGRVQRFTSAGAFDGFIAQDVVNGPSDVTVDTATDHVFISGSDSSFTSTGVFELDADGQLIDVHGSGVGFFSTFISGLAVKSSSARIYVAEQAPRRDILILDDVAAPTVAIDSVTDFTATTAVFSGAVNSQGPPNTSYRFEYSTDGSVWTPVPASDVAIGEGTTDTPVTELATGLAPNTEYRVRLVATKDFNAASATSDEVTFSTATAPPLIRTLGAGSRTATVAWLGGEVNPQNLPTSYYIEYTLADDVGYASSSTVPAAPAGIGSGGTYVTVSELATGLRPDSSYRFRIVAANDAGTTAGPDQTFATRAQPPTAPPGRAYEMVSPLDKNGGDIDRNMLSAQYASSGAAASGDAVAYVSLAPFADIPAGAPQAQYRSVRGPAGWSTRGISAPMQPEPIQDAVLPSVWFFSEDLSKAVVTSNAQLTAGSAELLGGSWGLYLQDNDGPTSSYQLLSAPVAPLPPEPAPKDTPKERFNFAAASDDMRHVVFEGAGRLLTPDATAASVYEWVNGGVRVVSRLPSETPANGRAGGLQSAAGPGQRYPGDHLISNDGKRIFFTVANSLYVREDGTSTTLVSRSERVGADADEPRQGTFQTATADDGRQALFTSRDALTDDATVSSAGASADLYLWDADAPEGQRLSDLTTADPGGSWVLGVAAAADDLSRAYFIATGALASGAVDGRPNLYVWTRGAGVRHIAALALEDEALWSLERDEPSSQFGDARASVDGNRLLFASRARLTAHDNAGRKQIFMYDAETDRTLCISCGPLGGSSTGDAWLFYPVNLPVDNFTDQPRMPYRLPRNLSADGSRAFFETDQALVSQDTNGQVDVYMWAAGELSLISTGKGAEPSEFIDASADGDDVFFTTRQRLVGADSDSQVDVYDARVGGGFPEQQLPPECVGDQCQGGPADRPETRVPASAEVKGPGNVGRRPGTAFSLHRLSGAQQARLARGRRTTVRVRVDRSGLVELVARAKLAGRTVVVAKTSKRAREAGVLSVSLRLAKPARRRLARGHALSMSLSARFQGAERTRRLTLRPRRAER